MTAINGVQMRLIRLGWRILEAEEWLDKPHKALKGVTPNNAIKRGRVEAVHQILDRLVPEKPASQK